MNLTFLTLNLHKGFGAFNRRFVLPELREAVRSVSADVVFLQEVMGEHELHAAHIANWPQTPHYEFLADSLWSDFAYGRNAVYPQGHHGNALLSKFIIEQHHNHDVSTDGPHERRGLLHCVLSLPGGRALHAICVHLGLRASQRQQQVQGLCRLIDSLSPQDPVVVAGDSGCAEVVRTTGGGQVVPVGDTDATARAIREVLDNPAHWRSAAAEAGPRVRDTFGAETVCEHLERMYLDTRSSAAWTASAS